MTKRIIVVGMLALGLTVMMVVSLARAAEKVAVAAGAKADQVTLTGRMSCTFCTLAHPDKTCTKECCVSCLKVGDPASLTVADGNIYILLSGEKGTALLTPERTAMLGEQVTVKGLLVQRKGIQAVYVDSMEKAAAKK